MKLKKADLTMIAKLPENQADFRKAKNLSNEKETVSRYTVIDKKTEREIINCAVYMGRSSNSSQVYASIWISGKDYYISGYGFAGGYGYHKESAAIGDAIRSAGVKLFGKLYHGEQKDLKKECHIGGVGESAIRSAFIAIAYALGSKDIIIVSN